MSKSDIVVYIGPHFRGGKLKQGTIFKGDIPAYLQPEIEKYPGLEMLFVEPRNLSQSMRDMRKRGHGLNVVATEVAKGENQ